MLNIDNHVGQVPVGNLPKYVIPFLYHLLTIVNPPLLLYIIKTNVQIKKMLKSYTLFCVLLFYKPEYLIKVESHAPRHLWV